MKLQFSIQFVIQQGSHDLRTSRGFQHLRRTRVWPYAGSKQKSSMITQTKLFATKDKARPCTEGTEGLNLAAVRLKTVQVTKLSL